MKIFSNSPYSPGLSVIEPVFGDLKLHLRNKDLSDGPELMEEIFRYFKAYEEKKILKNYRIICDYYIKCLRYLINFYN